MRRGYARYSCWGYGVCVVVRDKFCCRAALVFSVSSSLRYADGGVVFAKADVVAENAAVTQRDYNYAAIFLDAVNVV